MSVIERYMRVVIAVLVLHCLGVSSGFAAEKSATMADTFKLKPGAYGKLCIGCHESFKEKMAKPVIHTPLKKGECTGCHNPHSASHGKLIVAKTTEICQTCHGNMLPQGALSTHKVVADGDCAKCHDPHASSFKNNLLASGNQLCAGCHAAFGDPLSKLKFAHAPVQKDCLICHVVHGSAKEIKLLKAPVAELCLGCHKTDAPVFIKKHLGYPVQKAKCTGCHDPHGSNMPGILYNEVHKPVLNKMCNQCHGDATSTDPLKLRRVENDLCKGCHSTLFNKMQDSNRMHGPINSKLGCLSCHSPHASKERAILKAPMLSLCGSCHADTIKRQSKSPSKHEPVMKGECTSCHDPHASNNLFFAKKEYQYELCLNCHDWGKHSAHPIGEKARDPRNKNLGIGCTSCHRSHGTEFTKMFYYPSVTDTCVQCHEQFKR